MLAGGALYREASAKPRPYTAPDLAAAASLSAKKSVEGPNTRDSISSRYALGFWARGGGTYMAVTGWLEVVAWWLEGDNSTSP